MARLVAQLRTDDFEAAAPVQQAAYAHYGFAAVHPFSDGNGRVARALASIYLYRRPGLPLVVFNDEKPSYLAALEAADDGRYQPLVSFVGERLIDTVNLLKGPQGFDLPPVEEQAAAFAKQLNGRSGLSHSEVDVGAARLLEAFTQRLEAAVQNAHLSSPLSGRVDRAGSSYPSPPSGFRQVPGVNPTVLSLQNGAPGAAEVQIPYMTAIARGMEGDEDYLLYSAQGEQLAVFIREVLPEVTTTLQFRLDSYIDGSLRAAMAQLGDQARAALQQNGYS